MKNRAFVVDKIDDKFICNIKDVEIPVIGENEILIKTTYSSVNFKDALSSIGNPGVTRKFPHITGVDVVGTVQNSNSTDFNVGDRVIVTGYDLGMNTDGGHTNYVKVPSSWAIKTPDTISDKDIMTYGTAGLTAALSVNELVNNGITPESGEVIVTGATGGVGSVAVSILTKIGFTVTAVNGKIDQAEFLKSIGASTVININELDVENKRPMGKAKYAAVIDSVGGNILAELLKVVKYDGVVTCCGLTAGIDLSTNIFPFILRGVRLVGIDSVECTTTKKLAAWEKLSNEWKINTLAKITTEISLDEIEENYKKMLAGKALGRVVVKL